MTRPASLRAAAPPPTRERILAAAAAVFAREGLKAATTREIARAAGVNEVTLFRVFRSKRNLLAAVLDRVFSQPVAIRRARPAAGEDLAGIVREFALAYSARLRRNLTLIRVLVGEIQHFHEHELKVIRGIFRPERERLIAQLRAARKAGRVRLGADPVVVADQVSALVFMGELRSALPLRREYGARRYLAACIATVVRGIETR